MTAAAETFEECGVLLAAHSRQRFPAAPGEPRQASDLVGRRATCPLLAEHGPGAARRPARPLGALITPTRNPKRYDTAFLVARVPEGQVADDVHHRGRRRPDEAPRYRPRRLRGRGPAAHGAHPAHAAGARPVHDAAAVPDAAARRGRPDHARGPQRGLVVTITPPGDPDWRHEEVRT
ncbi:hypothetical protein HBB16_12180 [Pseudonocardia sp. MCCB 268]|nr:hypothetical protein [Pseudonocardia cytotoxica]